MSVTQRELQTSNMASGTAVENHIASRPRLKNVEFEDVVVDAAYAQLLRHHTSTPDELAEAVAFSQELFTMRQLGILLAHMGPRLPLAAEDVHVERKNRGGVLRADIRFSLHVRWTSGRLCISRPHLPDTLAMAAIGRPLRDVLDHPYIPENLVIASIDERDRQWIILPGTMAA